MSYFTIQTTLFKKYCCNWKIKNLNFTNKAILKSITNIAIVILFLLGTNLTLTAQNIPGIAPVQNPTGGFEVDNDPFANTPTTDVGDWFVGDITGNGGGLFIGATPIDPIMTTFCQDTWGTKDPTSFLTSNKINDDPSTYSWGLGNVPNKNEIENAAVHFSWGDPTITGGNASDLWCVFAGDRQVTNGASYIDFEFLQKPLTMTGAIIAEDGTVSGKGKFVSGGTDGGRTAGDVLVTIEFVRGGGEANVVVNIWQDADIDGKTDGVFEYLQHPNSEYLGDIYMTSNITETNNIPFDVYGNNYYVINQWAEGAINLSAIFNPNGDNNCFDLSTVFVRTRTSGESDQSELKDFPCPPIQIDFLNLKLVCSPDIELPACSSEDDILAAYTTWKNGFTYTGGRHPITDNSASIPTLPENYKCGIGLEFTYTVTDACGTEECTSTFTVLPDLESPVISTNDVSGDLGCNPTVIPPSFTGLDNCDGVFEPSVADGGKTLTSGDSDCTEYSQTWTATYQDNCENDAVPVVITYTWKEDLVAPVISTNDVSGDLGCNPTVIPPSFTGLDNCDGVFEPSVADGGKTLTSGDSDCTEYSQTWTATYQDNCENDAVPVVITYTWKEDLVAPVISTNDVSGDLGCNPTVIPPSFTGLDNCDGVFEPSVADGGKTLTSGDSDCTEYSQTWTATYQDNCENDAVPVVITYTWKEDLVAPVISTNDVSGDLGCNPTVIPPSFTGLDNCDGVFEPSVADGGKTLTSGDSDCTEYSQTWTATYQDNCENDAVPVVITYTWKEDLVAPVISTNDVSGDLGCNPTVIPPSFTGLDNCDGVFEPSVADGGKTLTSGDSDCTEYSQTWTATYQDNCENDAVPVVITYTWKEDLVAPVISTNDVSGDLGCNPTVIPPSFTGLDNCDGVFEPSVADGGKTLTSGDSDCTEYSQTWTATYQDNCENDAVPVVITYTWKEDLVAPVISTNDVSGDLGCNPTVIPPSFTGLDNCDGVFEPSVADGGKTLTSGDSDCTEYSQTWTATYQDNCENDAVPVVITYTWKEDLVAPVIHAPEDYTICNDELPVSINATWTDNCSDGGILTATGQPYNSTECATTYSYTFNVTDDCGNQADEKVVYITRNFDKYDNCETAFARYNDESQCFLEDGFNRWGWTNSLAPSESAYTLNLYAGAAGCDISKGKYVGTVDVTYNDGLVTVQYFIKEGYAMSEAQVYVGCNPYPTKKGKETVAPGQYTFKSGSLDHSTGITATFDVGNYTGNIYVIAHAVTCEEVCKCSSEPGINDNKDFSTIDISTNCTSNNTVSATLKTYPVPFDETLTVQYKFEYDTDVKIKVFDMKGLLITSDSDTNYVRGKIGSKILDLSRVSDEVLIVRVISNRDVLSKLVISKSVKE